MRAACSFIDFLSSFWLVDIVYNALLNANRPEFIQAAQVQLLIVRRLLLSALLLGLHEAVSVCVEGVIVSFPDSIAVPRNLIQRSHSRRASWAEQLSRQMRC